MIEYTLMGPEHVSQVAQLEMECFSDPWSERSITSELTNPLSCWIVALCDEHVVGYVGSQAVMGEVDMMNIAVSREHRRCGIAQGLVERLIAQLRSNACISLTLEVRPSNDPAIGLYQKLGFVQVGRRPGYYRNPREDALILRKEWES